MRLRSAMTGALAVFLVVVSSWASACDLSCSLQRMAGACDERGVTAAATSNASSSNFSSEMRMTSEHCAHALRTGNGETGTSASDTGAAKWISQAVNGEQPCSRNSVSASAVDETYRVEIKSILFVAVMLVNIGEPTLLIRDGKREAPPPRIAAVNPLSTNLRI